LGLAARAVEQDCQVSSTGQQARDLNGNLADQFRSLGKAHTQRRRPCRGHRQPVLDQGSPQASPTSCHFHDVTADVQFVDFPVRFPTLKQQFNLPSSSIQNDRFFETQFFFTQVGDKKFPIARGRDALLGSCPVP